MSGADRSTLHRRPGDLLPRPVTVCCAVLGVSVGWFYKWIKKPVTAQIARRRDLDAAVGEMFTASGGIYGSPRVHRDLLEAGWWVSEGAWGDILGDTTVHTPADLIRVSDELNRRPRKTLGWQTPHELFDTVQRSFV